MLIDQLRQCAEIFKEPLLIEQETDITVKMVGHPEIDITISFDTDRWTVHDNYFDYSLDSFKISGEAAQTVMEQIAGNLSERIIENA